MADENTTSTEKKSGLKKIIFIVALLGIEAAVLLGVVMVLKGPATVEASDILPDLKPEEEKTVEVLVLADRLLNSRSGINFLYDTEVWVHVKKKHEERVADELNRFRNELKAELMAIWRTAEPRQLQEPKMENLTRKAQTLLDRRFGVDGDTGEPIIQKCLIVSGPGFRVDG
ncbi:MAG: hypothetical protein ACR2GY_05960 [Phycisphaerales bacterium]